MASSDDEGEAVPHTVSNYYLVDENNDPISFLELPLQWNVEELIQERKQIFLHGTADNGLQKIYKQVFAWKFDIAYLRAKMFVLSKENQWMQLLKPRKSYEDVIRSILITVHFLHFARKKSETSGKSLWDHLSTDFSSYEIRPSEKDLIKDLVSEAIIRDETLAKSELVVAFLEGKLQKKKEMDEEIRNIPNASFIVNDDVIDEFEGDDESDAAEDLFDTVCSICDNGGDILCCDGRCMRSFHATEESGEDSYCESLGWTERLVEAVQSFICRNCQYKQHQCFACGELGSSDKLSGAEVFPCVSATCGRFYHLPCVAKLLHRDNAVAAEEFQKKVSTGGSFTCPVHKCFRCKKGEEKTDHDLQFAVCRRCPKAYHRKCLPREIAFEENEDEGIPQRAWEGLIPNRILIYCLKHKIDDELKTPIRDHIKFPGDEPKKKKEPQQLSSREKVIPNKKSSVYEDEINRRKLVKVRKGVHLASSVEKANMSEKSTKRFTGQVSVKKLERQDTAKEKPSSPVLGNRLYDYYANKSFKGLTGKERSEKVIEKPAARDTSSSVQLDNESKQRIMSLMEEARSSVTLEDILEKHNLPKTHVNSMKYVVDKTITLGKVEGSVEAIRAALLKLEEGGSIEDARAVCEPRLLHQITRWKNKMKVYLAPFLHGMRYTSFGRHFTKVDKLKEIVNVLHRYVQDGDMIVDFCCGANDFSWLMKTKLEQTGKKCSYKNYDILQAKNDFNFEKRDWMSVQKNELPEGSRLIMGLNPPFGVNAALANKFIDKALEFKPKLMILIVPKETERLDRKKKIPYDLIWEDTESLAGKSFYLPGSVDVYDNQLEDWNVSAPPLYLWSRPDWKAKHMSIAQQHGHLSRLRELPHLKDEEAEYKSLASDIIMEDRKPSDLALTPLYDHPVKNEEQVVIPEILPIKPENFESVPHDDDKKVDKGQTRQRDETGENSKKRKLDKEKQVNEPVKKLNKSEEREPGAKESGKTPRKKKKKGGKKSQHTPFNKTDNQPSRHHDLRSEREDSRERDCHLGHNRARSGSRSLTGYGITHVEENEVRPINQWSGPGSDYGERNLEEHFAGYRRESLDSHGLRQPYVSVEEQYARSAAVSRAGLYERQDPLGLGQRSSYSGSGQDAEYLSSYNCMGSTVDPRISSSTMQRYAPRLDEMNHMRVNNPAYDQFGAARPGYPTSLTPQPDYRVDSLGFAPGPRSNVPHNSSGWLNE